MSGFPAPGTGVGLSHRILQGCWQPLRPVCLHPGYGGSWLPGCSLPCASCLALGSFTTWPRRAPGAMVSLRLAGEGQ